MATFPWTLCGMMLWRPSVLLEHLEQMTLGFFQLQLPIPHLVRPNPYNPQEASGVTNGQPSLSRTESRSSGTAANSQMNWANPPHRSPLHPPSPPSPPCVTLPCATPLVLCLLQGCCATLGVGTATAPAPHPSSCPLFTLCPPTYMQPLLSLIHLCISFSLSLVGLRPVCSCKQCEYHSLTPAGFLTPLVVHTVLR
jgi:hypothetical protein